MSLAKQILVLSFFILGLPALAQARSLKGLVLDETSGPVVGARVILVDAMSLPKKDIAEQKTNRNGGFSFDNLTEDFYRLQIEAEKYPVRFTGLLRPSETEYVFSMDAELRSVVGQVLSSSGNPVPNATVSASIYIMNPTSAGHVEFARTQSDAAGWFSFLPVPADTLYLSCTVREGDEDLLVSATCDLSVQPDKPVILQAGISPDENVRITGSVLDAEGKPVPKARLVLIRPDREHWNPYIGNNTYYRLDSEAKFSIRRSRTGYESHLSMGLAAIDYTKSAATYQYLGHLPPDAHTSVVVLKLNDPGQITGRVIDSGTNEGVSGANVQVCVISIDGLDRRLNGFCTDRTDDNGVFRFEHLPHGRYAVRLDDKNIRPSKQGDEVEVNTFNPPSQLVLRSMPAFVVSGIVRNASGDPISSAVVTTHSDLGLDEQKYRIFYWTNTTRTNEKGEFTLPLDTNNPVTLFALAQECMRSELRNVKPPTDDVVFTMNVGRTIEGLILDEGSGTPVKQMNLRAEIMSTSTNRLVRDTLTDSDGKFIFENMPSEGFILLSTFDSNWQLRRHDPFFLETEVSEPLRLSVFQNSSISGMVVDRNGTPVAGAKLSANSASSSDWTSDASGNFHIGGTANGDILIRAEAQGVPAESRSGEVTIHLNPGETTTGLTMRLE